MNVREMMIADLDHVLENAWTMLQQGVSSRKHGFHHAAVATIGVTGLPRIRTVILRAADPASQTLRFHTDIRSQKCADLASNANIAAVFYDEASKTQVRVDGVASLHLSGELADASWTAAQPMSKITYGIMPEPGLAIASPERVVMPEPQTDVEWARKHFVVVAIQIKTLQWLYLKQGGQRCAVFDFSNETKTWTVPS
jgi:pyridoxamine 5'-phosphate oxidase